MSETTESNLTAAQIEDLHVSFAAMDPLEFACHLNSTSCVDLPDRVKSEWLRAKVEQKPTEREDAMRNAISRAMDSFWHRLATPAGEV